MLMGQKNEAEILIVEDEAIVATDIRLTLNRLGYHVTAVVSSGDGALESIASVPPDLVLMDIVIQGDMDGIQTARIIRDRWHIPVVFMSAFSDVERVERAKMVFPFGYILKPIYERDLKVTIEMALYVGSADQKRLEAERISKESEAHLREQTYLLQTLIDGIPDIVMLQKPDYSVLMFNSAGYRFLGVVPSEVDGKTCRDIMQCTSICNECITDKVLKSRKTEKTQEYLPRLKRWFRIHAIPVLEAAGNVRLVVKVFRDITDQKETTDALGESEEKFRMMYTNTSMGIARVSLDGEIIEANGAYCDMIGYTEAELIGKNLSDIIHPDDFRNHASSRSQICRGERQNYKTEKRFIHKDGRTMYGLLNASLIHNKKGKPSYLLSNVIDITDNKLAEQAQWQTHQTLITVLDSIDADIYVSDMENHEILFMNKHMRDSYGEASIGRPCFEVLRHEKAPCPNCTNRRLIGADGQPSGLVIWDGFNPVTKRWYMNYDQVIKWIDGRFVRIQVAMDITDLKQAAQENEKLESQLRQVQKMEAIGNLAGGIAHDFNNILGALVGYIELSLLDTPESDPNYDNLCQAFIASKRATDLVKQILTFSRQTEQLFSPVNITPIIKEAIRFLRSTLPSTIEMKSNLRETETTVLADPTQIYQVVINLCTNAAQAMGEGGGILSIGLSKVNSDTHLFDVGKKGGEYQQLTISDTGIGMDTGTLQRIFEPYFTTKPLGQGTGLGLAVVHGIIKSHQGTIKVYSEPNKGSTFRIYLPVVDQPPISGQLESSPLPGGAERILYVDDELQLLTLGKQMLERLGYKVDVQNHSPSALESIRISPDKYDLIITDQTMPQITGLEMAEKILDLNPDLPIILCTGFSEAASSERIKELGIRALLFKPLILRELAVTVRNIIDEQQLIDNASKLITGPETGQTL